MELSCPNWKHPDYLCQAANNISFYSLYSLSMTPGVLSARLQSDKVPEWCALPC